MANKATAIGQAIIDLYFCSFSKEKISEEIGSRWPELESEKREVQITKMIKGIDSLTLAIKEAGGNSSLSFIKEQRYFMSASELVAYLSLNDVLFIYTPIEERTRGFLIVV